jgi:hypothetical protein
MLLIYLVSILEVHVSNLELALVFKICLFYFRGFQDAYEAIIIY